MQFILWQMTFINSTSIDVSLIYAKIRKYVKYSQNGLTQAHGRTHTQGPVGFGLSVVTDGPRVASEGPQTLCGIFIKQQSVEN